jgi:glycosyltransferase involved in cell wall biosynthesis
MNIVGILSGEAKLPRAVHIYRLTMPLAYINKHTKHNAAWATAGSIAELTEAQIEAVLKADIVILGRMITDRPGDSYEYVKFLRRNGAKIIYETDDDLTEQYRDISRGKQADCKPFLANPNIDAFTVTTKYLGAQISKFSVGQPVFVLPNCIETTYWAQVSERHVRRYADTFNIMLVGTPTHGQDWVHAHQAALRILDEFPHTRLLVGGYQPDYIGTDERIVRLPFVEYMEYPTMLAEADVVVAAIDPDDPFNHSKSAVKAMEAWASKRQLSDGKYGGAAVIATQSVVYNGTVFNDRNGLLVENDVESYYTALRTLVTDKSKREYLQRTGMHDVISKHSIHTAYRQWVSAYTRIRRL